mgnify:CR=1 FL=1
MILKRIIPSTLLGRSIIIIFLPIIVLVMLTTFVFYQTSWNIISKRLTQSVVADINVIVQLIDQNLKSNAIKLAKENFKMEVEYKNDINLNPLSFPSQRGILSQRLNQALEELDKPYNYDLSDLNKGAIIALQLEKDLLIITVNKDRLFSGSAFVFLLFSFISWRLPLARVRSASLLSFSSVSGLNLSTSLRKSPFICDISLSSLVISDFVFLESCTIS